MKVQADIPEDLNRMLKIYKVENNLKRLGDAVSQIIQKYFEEHRK